MGAKGTETMNGEQYSQHLLDVAKKIVDQRIAVKLAKKNQN